MNVAIVGAGVIAQRYAERIAEVDGLTLVAVTDIVRERADALAAAHGAVAYETLEELLEARDVETVINLTIPAKHVEVTRAALEAGKHVHTEKPVALRADDAQALAALARERGVRLSSAPATLLGEAQQTAWKLIHNDNINNIKVVYAKTN